MQKMSSGVTSSVYLNYISSSSFHLLTSETVHIYPKVNENQWLQSLVLWLKLGVLC